ncbi:MAG: cupin domain-containing protein [Acidimicrobiales bacterium]|jgi:quercetin dioxygenase-like cupin family protein
MSRTEFDRIRTEGGYDEPYTVNFAERGNPEMHAHPFDAVLLMTSGELTLKFESNEQQMRTGDLCMVEAGTLHAEVCDAGEAIAIAAARPVSS